ncbi:CGNR zinc finger domain-containing protein [Microbacteriaceae bacterium VKM Ac-2855]|nr:CGNR zinc finger domain-containing protein [Microbacteriaceae bacterium VKM Ac-2855]
MTSAVPASRDIATGQWFEDETRWWFDSGSIALDFAYTGALGGRPERLHDADALAAWLSDRFGAVSASGRDVQPADALMLRASIAHLADAAASDAARDPSDVDVINLFAATPDVPPALSGGSRQAGATRASARQALSTIAREAVAAFSGDASGRIRRCSADDCGIVYLDTSRSGTRRWCSMQRCGNRAKVRAHRARTRELSR